MFGKANKVNASAVHKDNDDDVLICNPRPMLPAFISREVMDAARETLQAEGYGTLCEYYSPKGADGTYVLRTVPYQIEKSVFDAFDDQQLKTDVLKFYDVEGETLVLRHPWVYEHLEMSLHTRLEGDKSPIGVSERISVDRLLSGLKFSDQHNAQYFTLFNDTKNYFFYRKHHEHVPGLMLIEVARQAMYVHFYTYSGFRRGMVSISILELTSNFPAYTESAYPVDIIVSDTEENPAPQPKFIDKRAQFFQNGVMVAEIRLRGPVIKMNLFKRLRNIDIAGTHWFAPLKGISSEVLVLPGDGSQHRLRLDLLSMSGILVKADLPPETLSALTVPLKNCIIYVDSEGFITLPAGSGRIVDCNGEKRLLISFGEFRRDDRFTMREVLKQYAFVQTMQHPFDDGAHERSVRAG